MTHDQYMNAVIACFIGVILQLFYKAFKLNQKAKISNEKFNVIQWFADDYLALILNVLSPFILIYIMDEWITEEAGLLVDKLKSIFIFVGFSGSSVIMGFLSVADKKYNKIIDNKTNIADEKV
jgi:nitrate reductase gamma subunit